MTPETMRALEQAQAEGGAKGALEMLEQVCLESRNYPMLLEAMLMETRRRLGLPLIETAPVTSLPEEQRRAYDEAFIAAARRVGGLILEENNIPRAWPYFRAIGEPARVAEAMEGYEAGEDLEAVVEIALLEGVNPVKGFRLILAHHGICRAITCYSQFPAREGRLVCARLLVNALHEELSQNLRRAIEQGEGKAEGQAGIPEMIAGRDWLFGEYSYHVDTSHLVSVLQIALELEEAETLGKALEMAQYGQRLAPTFHHRSEPPFEEFYVSHAMYLRALLGKDVEAAIAYFRERARRYDPAEYGTGPAQVLVSLLVRLGQHREALDASLELLPDAPNHQLGCPTVNEICQRAGEFQRLQEISRERGDVLGYAAALAQQSQV
ncbi:MAG: hypothetical protein FJW20_12990 [Acidimicrobiia bacterium]|nr:hypothetical protein [Acidimicrobiia bacterium]